MRKTLVRDWMTSNPITIEPTTTLADAYMLMKQKNIRRLLVAEPNGKLVGIVTLGDVREAHPSDATTLSIYEINYLLAKLSVTQIMTVNPITTTPDATVYDAARLMLEHKIGGLPVVANGQVVGIITESDIFRLMVQMGASGEV